MNPVQRVEKEVKHVALKSEIENWINAAKNQLTKYNNTVNSCDKQIARLEPVYKELGTIKSDIHSTRKNTEAVIDEKRKWSGDRHTSFCKDGDLLDASFSDYYNQLDAAQDAINKKIGELKAKKKELVPIIGSLLKKIEQWKVDIQNAVN